MIGRKAEVVLNRAVRHAVENEHEYFTLEHVFWSLLSEPQVNEIIQACGGNPSQIQKDLEAYLQQEIPKVLKSDSPTELTGSSPENSENPSEHPVATLSIQRLIQRALFHVQSAGKEEIQPEDLLVALFQAKDSKALLLLSEEGIERLDVLNYISHGIRKSRDESIQDPIDFEGVHEQGLNGADENMSSGPSHAHKKPEKSSGSSKADDPLSLYAINLNDKAHQGRLDPLIGREKETDRILQILCRRRKNNALLVGEAGVGKVYVKQNRTKYEGTKVESPCFHI